MITIDGPWNKVGLGNHLFIYSYMRLLSEFLNYKMIVNPIQFSERNGIHPQGIYRFQDINEGYDYSHHEKYFIDDGLSNKNIDVDTIVNMLMDKKNHLISSGYYQKYSYWKKHKNKVKNYFKDLISTEKRNETDIAIHLRHSNQDPRISLSFKYYLDSIEKFPNGDLYLFADNFERHSELLKNLEPYNPKIMNLNVPDSFREISRFSNIICSQGSFSFWVAFLSEAKKIIWPITKTGPNRMDDWSIDYKIDDEQRYEFVHL